MKDGFAWRALQLLGNFILFVSMGFIARGNLWVLIPALLISLWNFIDGRFRTTDDYFVWPLLVIVVNVALNLWAISIAGGSLWILIPILFLGIWNFIDGRVRRQS